MRTILSFTILFTHSRSSSSERSMNQNKIDAQRTLCQREFLVFFNRIFYSVGIKLNPISCSLNENVKCIESGVQNCLLRKHIPLLHLKIV